MKEVADVDLDVNDREKAFSIFSKATRASVLHTDTKSPDYPKLRPHPDGFYFQNIPVDVETGLSAFPYKQAEEFGYCKVDILSMHVYSMVKSEDELNELLNAPVDWNWFIDERFFKNEDPSYSLAHLASWYWLCKMYPPKSVEDLAILIALKLPAKNYMIPKSVSESQKYTWDQIKERIWGKRDDEPECKSKPFKKSHAVAYALLVVLHAQLITRYLNSPLEEEAGEYFFKE